MELPLKYAVALVLLAGCSLFFQEAQSARILSVTFTSTKSHKITYEPLLRELARKGHEVTVLSPFDSKNETNFKNIKLKYIDVFSAENIFEMKLSMPAFMEYLLSPFLMLGGPFRDVCTESYEQAAVKQVLKEKWDLVFFTPFFNECLWGLVYKLNTTTLVYQQTAVMPWISDALGSPSPPSFVSNMLVGYSDSMTFRERIWNFVKNVLDAAVLQLYYQPLMESVYRKALNDPSIPSIDEIVKNTSLVLANSHISFAKPRPLMPDIVEVGGLHLVPPKPVPKDLEDFLGGAKDGFIYFSMGSALKGSTMPESYRKMFLNVFSKLKQRVLWKWETEKMDDLPSNVKLSKWLPQQDVLGHKNLRLFITHGGMGGTAEAIYHGVPLVGIPMFGDQQSNMHKAAEYGFAVPPLDFPTLTEEVLTNAINKAVNDPSYHKNAKRLSTIFKDQQNTPMDRALYWVEYVLRHKGAAHLRSASRDLGYVTYFSLDVIAVLLVLLLVSIKLNVLILRALYRRCSGSKAVDSKKKKKQ